MRRIVSLVLVIALCVSCLALRGFATENEEVESGIVEALRSVEPIKEQLGLSSVDFEQVTTSNHIFAYDYTNTGCVYNAELIPIKYDDELIGWVVIKAVSANDYIYQFSTVFVEEINKNLDALTEFAIIYDAQSCYLYNGVDLIKLWDTSITVATRVEVTEESLIDAGVVLNSIDINENLEYTSCVSNARTSSIISCNVGFVSQNPPSYLCWAASAACIINYIRGTNHDAITIADNWVGSGDLNRPLTVGLEDDVLLLHGVYYTYRYQVPSEPVILRNISDGYPILATFFTSDYTWHDVVIYGINVLSSRIYIMDPEYGFTSTPYTEYVGYVYENLSEGVTLTLERATCKFWVS